MNRGHAGAQGTIRAPAAATCEVIAMRRNSSFAALIFVLILGAGAAMAYATYRVSAGLEGLAVLGCAFILAFFISSGIQVADQWSRAVVLRLGKFRSLQGPGL